MNEKGVLKICYLVNQYPKISHTFIRREVLELESLGAKVYRVSIRQVDEELVDAVDRDEHGKTHFVISRSRFKSASAMLLAAMLCAPRLPRAIPGWCRLTLNARGFFLKHLFYMLEACWLLRFCKSHGVDHIHAHFGTNPAAVALFCHLLGGPNYSFTVHGPEEFDSPRSLSLREKLHHSKFCVAISSFCQSQLWRWAEFDDWHKVAEVHCTVDSSGLCVIPNPVRAKQRFVSIGRLCEQKGQMLLLLAIEKLVVDHPEVELHLIGDGEYRSYFEGFIADRKLESNVILHGWRSSEYIAEQLDLSTAMVLPSFAEGLPVVIMEAFARRRPVIATAIAGIPELVSTESGWLVPAGSVDALVVAMKEALQASAAALEEKGELGHKAVLARHFATTEVKKLYRLMEDKNGRA